MPSSTRILLLRHLLLPLLLAPAAHARAEEAPQDPSVACLKALQQKPEYQMLRGLVDVSGTKTPTPQMLANQRAPNERERAAVAALIGDSEACWRQGESWRAEHWPPEVAALFAQYAGIAKRLLSDLAAGAISYGDFAQTKSAAITRFRKELREILRRLNPPDAASPPADGAADAEANDDAAGTKPP